MTRVQANTHSAPIPSPINLRRSFFGYRRADVEAALDEQRRQLSALARALDGVWRDRERVREEFAREQARLTRELTAERERSGRVERRARLTALHLIGRAEKETARRRREAEAQVVEASARVDELLEVRENLLDELHTKVLAVASALVRPDRPADGRRSEFPAESRDADLVASLAGQTRRARDAQPVDEDARDDPFGLRREADRPLYRAAASER